MGGVGVAFIGVSAARATVGAGIPVASSPASLPISGTGVSVAAGIIGDVSAWTVCNAPGVGDTICSTPGSSVSSRPISSVPQPANSKTASENPANHIQVNSRVLATDVLATDVLATDVLAINVLIITAFIVLFPVTKPRSTIAFLLVDKPPVHIRSNGFTFI
jgi:hypothetical protein